MASSTESGLDLNGVLSRYLAERDEALGGEPDLPLFPAWDFRRRRMGTVPLQARGKALATALKKTIRELNEEYGMTVPEAIFSTHSLRRGGATAMGQANVDPALIQQHGRWTSECYKRYIEKSVLERLQATRVM